MNYKYILVTGGAGFVGSTICIQLKRHYPGIHVIALDNLSRRGSELNLPHLNKHGVTFVRGDVRHKKDMNITHVDLIIECSAEPSVLAGVTSSPKYVVETNLVGALNCFELARKNEADVIFLSTSRVYPVEQINAVKYKEEKTRFAFLAKQILPGISRDGISENFPLLGIRSLYGTTKLAAELVLQEYGQNYGIHTVVDRFGLISGPGQMGKADQGVIAYWLASHLFEKPLSYIGFGGQGKQVRDAIHVDDVFAAIHLQISNMKKYSGNTYNIGGGKNNSISLLELTKACEDLTGEKTVITKNHSNRRGDIRIYITDNKKFEQASGWQQKKNIQQLLTDTYMWMIKNKKELAPVLS